MKRSNLFFIMIILLFFVPGYFSAQTTEESSIHSESVVQEGTSDYVQKISWVGDENAWQYGVEIVSVDNTVEPLHLTTDQTFVTFTLPPGNYKYKIYVYDLFGRIAVESNWESLVIKKALKPLIIIEENIVANKKKKVEIPVNIEDISEASTVVIINQETKEEVQAEFKIEQQDGKNVATSLFVPKITDGNWSVKVTNPGGKVTVSDDVVINLVESEPLNLVIQGQVGYPFFTSLNSSLEILENPICFDYGFRLSVSPIIYGKNNFGFEFNFSSELIKQENSLVTLKMNAMSIQMNVLYKYEILENTLYATARAGWGGTVFDAFATGAKDYDFSKKYIYPSVNVGAGIMYKPLKYLNLELAVHNMYIFGSEATYVTIDPIFMVGVSF